MGKGFFEQVLETAIGVVGAPIFIPSALIGGALPGGPGVGRAFSGYWDLLNPIDTGPTLGQRWNYAASVNPLESIAAGTINAVVKPLILPAAIAGGAYLLLKE